MRPTDKSGTFSNTSGGVELDTPPEIGDVVCEGVGEVTTVGVFEAVVTVVTGLVGEAPSTGVANVRKRRLATKLRRILQDDIVVGWRGQRER